MAAITTEVRDDSEPEGFSVSAFSENLLPVTPTTRFVRKKGEKQFEGRLRMCFERVDKLLAVYHIRVHYLSPPDWHKTKKASDC